VGLTFSPTRKFSTLKIHRWDRKKTTFSSRLQQPPPIHDIFDDSYTYSHQKLYLCAMRYVSNNVNWVSHYTRTNFQLATLTLELPPHTCPTNLYLIYLLTHHMLSHTSCRFLSKSHITLSLKLKHVCYHFLWPCSLLYASLNWLDHYWVLAYYPTINTLDHFYA